MHLRTIACLVDFSDLSLRGLALGASLADRFGAGLIAFHAVHLPSDQLDGSDYPQSRPGYLATLAQARRRLQRLAMATATPIIPVLVCGDPVSELARLVESEPIDLIIAPSRGISALRRLFTGTLVERLVRRVDRPVLVCRPKVRSAAQMKVTIVVAGIPEGGDAGPVMAGAVAVARAFDADLHLVHACQAPPDIDEEPYSLAQHHHDERIRRQLLQAAVSAGADMPRTRAVVLCGTPAEAIGTHAVRLGADLVAVGVRRIGPVAKTVIGSTTEALLRSGSSCLLTLPGLLDPTAGPVPPACGQNASRGKRP